MKFHAQFFFATLFLALTVPTLGYAQEGEVPIESEPTPDTTSLDAQPTDAPSSDATAPSTLASGGRVHIDDHAASQNVNEGHYWVFDTKIGGNRHPMIFIGPDKEAAGHEEFYRKAGQDEIADDFANWSFWTHQFPVYLLIGGAVSLAFGAVASTVAGLSSIASTALALPLTIGSSVLFVTGAILIGSWLALQWTATDFDSPPIEDMQAWADKINTGAPSSTELE